MGSPYFEFTLNPRSHARPLFSHVAATRFAALASAVLSCCPQTERRASATCLSTPILDVGTLCAIAIGNLREFVEGSPIDWYGPSENGR